MKIVSSDQSDPQPKISQKLLTDFTVGGDFSVGNITQSTHFHVVREKPTGIPNNSPSGTGKFIGRTEALKDLHAQLKSHPNGIFSIVGMGGIGKSELAIQYSGCYQEIYLGGICWLNARTGDLLTQLIQYSQFYLGMVLPQELTQQALDTKDVALWYIANWRIEGSVLIILDDVTNLLDCKPLLDKLTPRFRVLITTRHQGLDASFFEISLDALCPQDAMQLLQTLAAGNCIEMEQNAAQDLCKSLGYLPLGIELVGRYLSRNPFLSVVDVKQSLSLQSEQLTPQANYIMSNQRGVWAAFELSWQSLDNKSQQLAHFLSFFAPGEILEELVSQVMAEAGMDKAITLASKTTLYQQSLLQKADGMTLRIHPLIQEFFTIKRQSYAHQDSWRKSYIQGTAKFAASMTNPLAFEDIAKFTSVTPHIIALLRQSLEQVPDDQLGILFGSVTYFYNNQAIYPKAQHWAEKGLSVLQERLGDGHSDIGVMLDILATLYQVQGQYKRAESLYWQALQLTKQVSGNSHPNVVAVLNNLACSYASQGRYQEAKSLLQQTLAITKKTLGEQHLNFARSLNNLADLYISQGHYREAEPLLRQTIEITEQTLGDEHPDLAETLNNLAILYVKTGRYSNAEPLLQKALKIIEQTLGSDHPTFIANLKNTASLFFAKGRYREAEPLLKQALEITKQVLGVNHPSVAMILNGLAATAIHQEHYSEAESLYRKALELNKRTLGDNHPSYATNLHDLASLYQVQGYHNKAEPLLKQALDINIQTLGRYHPDIAKNLNNLAGIYHAQGLYGEAASLVKQALEINIQTLGHAHPEVEACVSNLYFLNKVQMLRYLGKIFKNVLLVIHVSLTIYFLVRFIINRSLSDFFSLIVFVVLVIIIWRCKI